MESIKDGHFANLDKIASLKKQVQSATSSDTSSISGSPGSANEGISTKSKLSPASIASQLFHRTKSPKSRSPSGSANKAKTQPSKVTSAASLQQMSMLEEQILETKKSEMGLVSAAIGMSEEGASINTNGNDQVLDLADRLLAQLDAKKEEQVNAANGEAPLEKLKSPPIPAPGHASNAGIPIFQPIPIPVPIPGATATVPPSHVPAAEIAATLPPKALSPVEASPSSLTGLGQTLKKVLSPPDSSSTHPPRQSSKISLSPHPSRQLTSDPNSGGVAIPLNRNEVPKQNRHAVRKERRKAKDDALRAEAQAEVDASKRENGGMDPAEVEKQGIERVCKEWNLVMIEMDPDGHCMYSAIADQLVVHRVLSTADYHTTRRSAAEYMRSHMDDFLPYLPAEDEDGQGEGLLSSEGYARHCHNVEATGEWGSETEILALSKYYEVPIYVIQADSPADKVGQDEPYAEHAKPLTISYHRRMYGLGEHYNSLRPASVSTAAGASHTHGHGAIQYQGPEVTEGQTGLVEAPIYEAIARRTP